MVIATQNPIEQEGTYPLPEAQLDRFLFKVDVGYPTRDEERTMVRVHGHRTATPPIEEFGLQPVAGIADLVDMRRVVAAIRLEEPIVDYVVDLVRATRGKPSLLAGASPRAANMLATAARAHAAVQGRDFVIPDDVKALALPVLRHRVVLAPGAEVDGLNADGVLRRVVEEVGAPR
jgi:MoxR-like ATPase